MEERTKEFLEKIQMCILLVLGAIFFFIIGSLGYFFESVEFYRWCMVLSLVCVIGGLSEFRYVLILDELKEMKYATV